MGNGRGGYSLIHMRVIEFLNSSIWGFQFEIVLDRILYRHSKLFANYKSKFAKNEQKCF